MKFLFCFFIFIPSIQSDDREKQKHTQFKSLKPPVVSRREVVTTPFRNLWDVISYVKASNTGDTDYFGHSLSLNSDGSILAVGAYKEDSSATGVGGDQENNETWSSGAAYVFVRDGKKWTQQAYIKASNPGNGDYFGYSLSLNSDGSILAVGAYKEGSSATGIGGDQKNNDINNSGAAYVFVRDGKKWTQQAYIKASNPGNGDYFGHSLSLNSDGSILAVGAYKEDSSATGVGGDQENNETWSSGAAYVFVRDGKKWTQQAYIKASNPGNGDYFGYSLSLNSGGNVLAVGAIGEDSSATGVGGDQENNETWSSGAAYVFVRDGKKWTQQAYIKASNPGNGDYFGYSLSLNSGGNVLAVGAIGEDSSATGVGGDQENNETWSSGAAYVFVRDGKKWTQQAYIKASNPGNGDYFGYSLSLNSGGNVLAVGAPGEGPVTEIKNNAIKTGEFSKMWNWVKELIVLESEKTWGSGVVYVFVQDKKKWTQQAYIKASNTESLDKFGRSLNLNSDGNILAVGIPGEDSNTTGVGGDQKNNDARDSGAVYVYGK